MAIIVRSLSVQRDAFFVRLGRVIRLARGNIRAAKNLCQTVNTPHSCQTATITGRDFHPFRAEDLCTDYCLSAGVDQDSRIAELRRRLGMWKEITREQPMRRDRTSPANQKLSLHPAAQTTSSIDVLLLSNDRRTNTHNDGEFRSRSRQPQRMVCGVRILGLIGFQLVLGRVRRESLCSLEPRRGKQCLRNLERA